MDPVTFGPFAFNRGKGTLTREGKHVSLGGRSSALLMALLDAQGSVVSKADLMERVWPGVSVEEGNLTVQVAALRKALGQRADNSDWIITVARIGYRLWTEDAEAPREASSPLPSLAVLPFHDLGGDAAQDYFADGIVDDLITALSRFKTFAVISRNSSFVYKEAQMPPPELETPSPHVLLFHISQESRYYRAKQEGDLRGSLFMQEYTQPSARRCVMTQRAFLAMLVATIATLSCCVTCLAAEPTSWVLVKTAPPNLSATSASGGSLEASCDDERAVLTVILPDPDGGAVEAQAVLILEGENGALGNFLGHADRIDEEAIGVSLESRSLVSGALDLMWSVDGKFTLTGGGIPPSELRYGTEEFSSTGAAPVIEEFAVLCDLTRNSFSTHPPFQR